ncbi:hypothetical protein ACRN9Z_19245 [Shewanella frigidimarina]|uniref:hypothetical protein n=1 Tax=Shewanella frigidimarina TaxID=56812 RepID=UPI003D79D368
MFGREKKLEIEKELTKRQLKFELMKLCSDKTLRTVKTASEKHAVIQVAGIASVTQEKAGWYYNDETTETMIIKYLDDSWVRLDMKVADFITQVGLMLPKGL